MFLFDEVFKDVLGRDDLDHANIEGGDALIYLIRRFGYPNQGSDDHKQVCAYLLPTNCDDLRLYISIRSVGCSVMPIYSRDLDRKVRSLQYKPLEDWRMRARDWNLTLERRFDVVNHTDKEAFFNFILDNAKGEVSNEEKNTLRNCISTFDPINSTFDTEDGDTLDLLNWWHHGYMAQKESGWVDLLTTYKDEVEPYPETTLETYKKTELGKYLSDFKEALKDLLRPVYVRDAPINILGGVEEEQIECEEDEDGELVSSNVVERHPSAGYGVPKQFLDNADKFLDLIHEIGELGDFWETADMIINKQYQELANLFLRLSHKGDS